MRNRFVLLAAMALFAACQNESLEYTEPILPYSPDTVISANLSGNMMPGMLRVKFKDEPASDSELVSSLPGLTVISATRTFPCDPRFEERTRAEGLHLWYDVIFDEDMPVTKAAVAVLQDDKIEEVEGVRVPKLQTAEPFNDPYLSRLWSYHNDGSKSQSIAGADAGIFEGWNYETGKDNVIVAVMDGGIRYTHEDLADAVWINKAEAEGQPGVDDDGNGFVDDIYGYNFCSTGSDFFMGTIHPDDHGTHVSGTIAAVNNNGIGGAGIAGGNGTTKGVRVMSCQIIDGNFGSDSGAAFKYAADNGAVISNNSWSNENGQSITSSEKAGIEYFKKYAGIDADGLQTGPMAGGIVFFAAGNESTTTSWPAQYEGVYAVSAIASNWKPAYYTNYGEWVDISAPGGDARLGPQIFSCTAESDSSYDNYQGTSMACPHVSGVAALVVSRYGGPGFTPEKLWNILSAGAAPSKLYEYNPGMVGKLGIGMVSAGVSLQSEGPLPPEKVTGVSAKAKANFIDVSWLVASDPESGKATGNAVFFSRSSLADFSVSQSGVASDASVCKLFVPTGVIGVGESIGCSLEELEFSTRYYIRICAIDNLGNYGPLSDQIQVATLENNKPDVTAISGTEASIKEFQQAVLRFNVSDKDGHSISVRIEGETKGVVLSGLSESGECTVTFIGSSMGAGKHITTLTADDGYDETAVTLTCTVAANNPPAVSAVIKDIVLNSKSETRQLDLLQFFTDPDEEVLSYTVNSSSTSIIVKTSINGGILDIAANWFGTTSLTVTASDAMGKTVSQEFRVLVRDGSREYDIYPNPVKDKLNIRSADDRNVRVKVFSGTGAKVFESDFGISPFEPAQIDMNGYRSGSYTVVVRSGESEDKYVVVKSE